MSLERMRESNESDAYPFDLEKSERELWFSQLISGIKKSSGQYGSKSSNYFCLHFHFCIVLL